LTPDETTFWFAEAGLLEPADEQAGFTAPGCDAGEEAVE